MSMSIRCITLHRGGVGTGRRAARRRVLRLGAHHDHCRGARWSDLAPGAGTRPIRSLRALNPPESELQHGPDARSCAWRQTDRGGARQPGSLQWKRRQNFEAGPDRARSRHQGALLRGVARELHAGLFAAPLSRLIRPVPRAKCSRRRPAPQQPRRAATMPRCSSPFIRCSATTSQPTHRILDLCPSLTGGLHVDVTRL
jgi:hypothetical protein